MEHHTAELLDRTRKLLKDVTVEVLGHTIELQVDEDDGHVYIMPAIYRPDSVTGAYGWGHGLRYEVWPDTSDDVIVKRGFVAARDMMEHEVREGYQWKGKAVLGPHVSLQALWDACDAPS